MGNCNTKRQKFTPKDRQERQTPYASHSSLDNAGSSRSFRYLIFGGSGVANSAASARIETSQRSRASRRTTNQGTTCDLHSFYKTKWPVPQFEAAFLPEFKIKEAASEAEYDFIDIISKGAYGQVYKVRNRNDGEIFALKVLSKAQIIAEDAIERVKDEVRIQQVVGHHPFVVNSSRHWQDRRKLYVGSDYVPGGELYTLVQDYGSLPEDAVRILVAEVALAIDFLHNAGVIHRDIKASNVLLDNEGHAQLIDFGFAKWLPHGHKTSTLCGTPRYIAPEILRREPYGHAVDWFSLGILMFFLLTTEYPESSSENGEPAGTSGASSLSTYAPLSNAARDLIKRLLEPEPSSRLKSIFGLQRVAFYQHRDFRGYNCKTVSPFEFISSTKRRRSTTEVIEAENEAPDVFSGFSDSAVMLPDSDGRQ
ncbi:serine/threonine-protein kinase S6KL [Athalia rosae]|uniref:serine/threonine-protein kinase S6KL n=1 Tax=Athalia rosae TaxID=37344 RepID=UPI002033FAE5|nr:serine/threonine-protein kinase S6KL [Athalia rosae]